MKTKGRTDGRTKGRKDERMKGRKDERTKGRKDARTKGRTYERKKGRKEAREKGNKENGTNEERKKARSWCGCCLLACVCLFAVVASPVVIRTRHHSSTLERLLSHFDFQYNPSLSNLTIHIDFIMQFTYLHVYMDLSKFD